jgi:hypothetical protein
MSGNATQFEIKQKSRLRPRQRRADALCWMIDTLAVPGGLIRIPGEPARYGPAILVINHIAFVDHHRPGQHPAQHRPAGKAVYAIRCGHLPWLWTIPVHRGELDRRARSGRWRCSRRAR